ncbi:hypothetical protein ACHAXR_006828 [Thalassiosira sp. AJA248-18]
MTFFSKISPLADFAKDIAYADDFDLALTIAIIELLTVARKEEINRKHYEKKQENETRSLIPSWSEFINKRPCVSEQVQNDKERV